MGDYATVAELKDRFTDDVEVAWLTDDEATEVPDATLLGKAIDEAEAFINSAINVRYLTPLTVGANEDASLTAQMRCMTLDVAVYRLFLRQPVMPEAIRQAYEDVDAMLDKINTGKRKLAAAVVQTATTAEEVASTWGTPDADLSTSKRQWTRETQENL